MRVVIYTGTGENFNADFRPKGEQLKAYTAQLQAAPQRPAEDVEASGWSGRNRHNNMLDIDAIMIAAVNGPVTIHSELPLMCDIVLASEKAYFRTWPISSPTWHPATGSRTFGRGLLA